MALARDAKGEDHNVVAIIGDGALTGGMAYEAINHAGHLPDTNLIVVLNDNGMSISPNVGAMTRYLSQLRISPPLQSITDSLESQLKNLPLVGSSLSPEIDRMKENMKLMTTVRNNKVGIIFEELGFTYVGPVDGHNLQELVDVFKLVQNVGGPILVHVATTKGKGYALAEKEQVGYHAQSSFNIATGKPKPSNKPKPPSYSKVFANTLTRLAQDDPRIIAITAAMATGTGLVTFQEKLPDQFFDVGIAEQHAVTLAAGMAYKGMRPVAAIYSTFLQRAYDQIVHDVCIQKLPVFFCMDRAGVVGADGPTHQGLYDISYLRSIPNMVVMAPKDEAELQRMLVTGINYTDGPIAVRYPRGSGVGVPLADEGWQPLEIGKSELLRTGDDVLIVSYGTMVHTSMHAAEILTEHGIQATVVNARFVKPLDTEMILPLAERIGRVVTVEEGCLMGGFGSAVGEAIMDADISASLTRIGVPDKLVDHAKAEESLAALGLTSSAIAERIRKKLQPGIPQAQPAQMRG